jgi:hypothetical protein
MLLNLNAAEATKFDLGQRLFLVARTEDQENIQQISHAPHKRSINARLNKRAFTLTEAIAQSFQHKLYAMVALI